MGSAATTPFTDGEWVELEPTLQITDANEGEHPILENADEKDLLSTSVPLQSQDAVQNSEVLTAPDLTATELKRRDSAVLLLVDWLLEEGVP